MSKRNFIPVSITLSPDVARKARVKAATEGKSRSQLVRELLEKELSKQDSNLEVQPC